MISETIVVAFTTFCATIGPIDVAAMTPTATPQAKRSMAIRGTIIAAVILVGFALVGEFLPFNLGLSLAAMRTAGGIHLG